MKIPVVGREGVKIPVRGTKKTEDETTEFQFSTAEELKGQRSTLPYVQARKEILDDPESMSLIGKAILAGRMAMRMPPVQSNAELQERLDEYFKMAQFREIPPTVEEMALYCGYTAQTIRDWAAERRKGFRDEPQPGITSAMIVKKALNLMHQIDAVLTESGKLNTVAYIFRSKNYYNMVDKQEITVSPSENSTVPLSPEEIAKRLPDPDADYKVE